MFSPEAASLTGDRRLGIGGATRIRRVGDLFCVPARDLPAGSYRPRDPALRKLDPAYHQEFTMIEQQASVHWEGAGKSGQGPRQHRQRRAEGLPVRFHHPLRGRPQGHESRGDRGRGPRRLFHHGFRLCLRESRPGPRQHRHDRQGAAGQAGRRLPHRPHRTVDRGQRAGHRRCEIPATGPGRQAELPLVEGAGGASPRSRWKRSCAPEATPVAGPARRRRKGIASRIRGIRQTGTMARCLPIARASSRRCCS